MMTTIQQELEANAPATAQKNINLKVLNDTYVSVPTIDEQREIVRILDDLFEQEQQAQSAVETVLADIDTLKKSILARAFRGELSTNDPKEENAVGMLKKVLCDLGGEN
jgi:type I restriction enzyme S subunit